jgi:hypothetical protein
MGKNKKRPIYRYQVDALRPVVVEVEASSKREAIEKARNGEGYIEDWGAEVRVLATATRDDGQ